MSTTGPSPSSSLMKLTSLPWMLPSQKPADSGVPRSSGRQLGPKQHGGHHTHNNRSMLPRGHIITSSAFGRSSDAYLGACTAKATHTHTHARARASLRQNRPRADRGAHAITAALNTCTAAVSSIHRLRPRLCCYPRHLHVTLAPQLQHRVQTSPCAPCSVELVINPSGIGTVGQLLNAEPLNGDRGRLRTVHIPARYWLRNQFSRGSSSGERSVCGGLAGATTLGEYHRRRQVACPTHESAARANAPSVARQLKQNGDTG